MDRISSVPDEQRPAPRTSLGYTLISGLLGGLLASVINIILWLVTTTLLRLALAVPMGPGGTATPVSPAQVAITSMLPGLIAGGLYWLLARFVNRPRPFFVGISILLLLLSLGGPLGMPGIASPDRYVLAFMHVIAAVAIIGVILKRNSSET